jgi:tetratricopeptide (TPR) repeat protein
LGDVSLAMGDSKAALLHYQMALDVRRKLAEADSTSAADQRDLSVSYEKLGDVSLTLGDSKAALGHYQKALDVLRKLAEADPTSAAAQRDLLVSYFKLGNVCQRQTEFTHAATWFQKALDIRARLAEPQFVAREAKIIEERLALCQAAGKALEDLSTAKELPPALRGPVLGAVARALLKQQKLARAAEAAGLLAQTAAGADDLYNAACVQALFVPSAAGPEQKEKYAARAVELLHQAVQKGYKNAAHLKKDTDLDALRSREDFKKLLADLEAGSG